MSRADSLSPTRENTLPTIHDTIIIGAGPCGLAVAARLREQTPSAVFTDEEARRYHWINKHTNKAQIKNSKTGQIRSSNGSHIQPSILVLDSSGDSWMAKWDRLFKELEISHLRSPMFFHPDPHDRDGLLAYAHEVEREDECLEIAGCVGREISKHQMKKKMKRRKQGEQAKPTITIDERDRKDYFAPPSDMFKSYCESVAKRYNLNDKDLIQKAVVEDIDYDYVKGLSPNDKLFTLRTDAGLTLYAHSVVLAVGAGNAPTVPKPFPQNGGPCASHAFQPGDRVLKDRLKQRKTTNVLVIGGGLTSAQIADRAVRRGATRVFHVMRGPMKVKPFDVDLSWMGKFRNHEKASFWSADTDEERSELVKTARNGGSITPRFAKLLSQHEQTNKLSIHTHTAITQARFNPLSQTWSLTTSPPIAELPEIHFVYFATGVQSDIHKLPYLQKIVEKFPTETYEGIPALTDDLMWCEGVPLFVTGKFASLRLGPGAGNLEGARLGAERIAWAIGDVLGEEGKGGEEVENEEDAGMRYVAGIGSKFGALEMDE